MMWLIDTVAKHLDENCDRLVQFMLEQIDYRNCYEADCQLIREETCDIIELLATE